MHRQQDYDHPVQLGQQLTLRNGYCLAPLSTQTALFNGEVSRNDCYFHQQHAKYVGLDIVGSAYVAVNGSTAMGSISVADDQKIPGLRQLATTIQRTGAKAILQLVHAGRMTNPVITQGTAVVAPSTIQATHWAGGLPETLTAQAIDTIVDQFGAATQRAILAGFDGVELHGANGFLLQQFLSPLSNRRTDAFGGTLENRLRVPLMVVKRVLQVAKQASKPFVVGYRFSPEEVESGGLSLVDSLVLTHLLSHLPLSYLSLSLRRYNQQPVTIKSTKTVVDLIAAETTLPLMVAGHIRTASDVQTVAAVARLVAIGRPLMVDPHWPLFFRQPERLKTTCEVTAAEVGITQQLFHYL